MALTSTLGSPGIEIREVDNSYRLDSSTATTVFIPGFASQGPVDEVSSISSIGDFETIYGKPTNAAQRYFYYTVKAVLDNSGNGVTVLTSRLPYGSGAGDTVSNAYTLLSYPAVPVIRKKHKILTGYQTDETKFIKVSKEGTKSIKFGEYLATMAKDATTWTITKDDATVTDATIDDDFILTVGNDKIHADDSHIYQEKTYEFDQFTLESDTQIKSEIEKLITDAFIANGKTPTLEEMTLVVDQDKCSETSFEITNVPSIQIPSITETTTDNGTTFLNFGNTTTTGTGNDTVTEYDFCATGTVASQVYQIKSTNTSETKLYLSGVMKNKDNVIIGSIYMRLKYDGDVTTKETSGKENTSIIFSKKETFETAASYQGCSKEQEEAKDTTLANYSDQITYIIGSPVTYQISLNDYYKILTGQGIKWSRKPYNFTDQTVSIDVADKADGTGGNTQASFGRFGAIGHSAFIVINTSRSIINDNFEGFYLGMTDNMFVNPSDDYTYNAVENVKITTKSFDIVDDKSIGLIDRVDNTGDYHTLNDNRLSFYLNNNYNGSISQVLTRGITPMDVSGGDYDDTISMGLFKLTKNTSSNDILKLTYSLREKYNWSFGKTRIKSVATATKPVSYFVENVTQNSKNLTILMNPFIAEKSFVDTDGNIHGKIRVLGSKLVNNLDYYQKKYLLKNYLTTSTNANGVDKSASAVLTAKLAKSSIQSWKTMIKQAGVTPSLLKSQFKSLNASSTKGEDFYNFSPLNSLIPFGTYSESSNVNKLVGQVPSKVRRALELVENDEEYPDIDIVLESGLGTVYAYSCGGELASESATSTNKLIIDEDNGQPISGEQTKQTTFKEDIVLAGVEDLRTGRTSLSDQAQQFVQNYKAVQDVFTQFANSMQNGGRGDTFYISDVPRGILIKGKDTKVSDLFGSSIENNAYDFGDKVNHSFSTSIYYPIKHTFDNINSSYMSTYAQWVKILDGFSGEKVWIPVSGYITGNMAATDSTYGPWYAAAGLRRGVISGVLDYAISPNVSQRTDLYKLCINSVPRIPNYGVTIWGIRTMSKAASAFDQNTCRRTFLYMEKKVKQTLRYYLFEPNNSYTRLQIMNDIDPFLEKIKNAGGIYSYTLVCDTTINTPDVINNGDLAVAIAAAPTRTAENIVVQFTANKYTEEVSSSESI